MKRYTLLLLCLCLLFVKIEAGVFPAYKNIQKEQLGRGVVAINQGNGKAFIAWRYLETDPLTIGFDVFKSEDGATPLKLNEQPITQSTTFQDTKVKSGSKSVYSVCPIIDGQAQTMSIGFTLSSEAKAYLSIPVNQAPNDANFEYAPNDAMVGDLDGDGEYEIVIKRMNSGLNVDKDGPMGFDNSQGGICKGGTLLEAYKLDGTFMWRVDLGMNIRQGAHYTHPIVYDFDGDGKAEVTLRTSEGTIFGDGTVIGDVNGDGKTDYVNRTGSGNKLGQVVSGPEFLSVIEGTSGKELVRAEFIARGDVKNDWLLYRTGKGDDYGGRSERTLAGMGYFDGAKPSILICRGYYGRTVLEAWDYRSGELIKRWRFDTQANSRKYEYYEGRGNHSLSVGDVDGDGKDEVVYGGITIDDNGEPLYNTELRHGDAMHLTDLDPDRSGLEVWACHEESEIPYNHKYKSNMRDATTGEILWGVESTDDVGRCMAGDIDPKHRGCEMWSSRSGGIRSCKGEIIVTKNPPMNMAVWWDGDLNRELLDGVKITKWIGNGTTTLLTAGGCSSNNSTKSNPCIHADILGDWREEVVWRSADNKELRVYVSTIPTDYRFHTLMHDPIYRNSTAIENVGYNQPTQIGRYFGSDLGKYTGQREVDEPSSTYVVKMDIDYDGILRSDGSLANELVIDKSMVTYNEPTKVYIPFCFRGAVLKDSITVTLRNVSEIETWNANKTTVYPSVSKEEVQLRVVSSDTYMLTFYTIDGRLILRRKLPMEAGSNCPIDIRSLTAGSYLLVVSSDKDSQVFRITKE